VSPAGGDASLIVGITSVHLDLTLQILGLGYLIVVDPKDKAAVPIFYLTIITSVLGALLKSIGCKDFFDIEKIAVGGRIFLITKGGFMCGQALLGLDPILYLGNWRILAK
jgi:hypothetical protein